MGQISSGGTPHSQLEPLNIYVPEEILIHILSYVDPKTLLQFRLVCQAWKALIDKEVWRLKVSRAKCRSLRSVSPKQKLPWYVYYSICSTDPFEKNLVLNHCGQLRLKRWEILSNGGNHWRVEDPPQGADEVPECEEIAGKKGCFATSYHSCSKEQIIDLASHGFTSHLMDELQPDIMVSEWYAGRFDCGCVYEMQVTLLDEEKKAVTEYSFRDTIKQWEGSKWHQVSHVFKNYGQGVRYVKFYHGGQDSQFWAGHYGSKMTGACVKLVIPLQVESESENDLEEDSEME